MSSRVKLEKYRSQLEEAWKENSALRNQLVEESTFQRQLGSQLIEVEQGFLGTKNMTESLKEIWDAFRQAKVLTSKTLNDMLLTERQRIKATMTHADELRDVCFQKLTERVQELEGELLNCRKENSELQFRCQALQDQLQLSSTVIQKDSRTGSEQNLSEEDMQAAPLNCTHEKLSSPAANFQEAGTVDTKSNQFDDQLSDGGFGSKQRMAVPMLKVDLWSGSTPKDYKVGLRDDSWLKHEGSGALGTILNTEAGHEDQDEVKEMLMMSREQIRTLERQLLLANLEKDRASSLLTEHIQAHEKSMVAMKLEKLKFAEELKSIMEAIALQDSFVTSICHGIEEYEKGVDHECPTLRMQVISG